jgi:hypothetical protein
MASSFGQLADPAEYVTRSWDLSELKKGFIMNSQDDQ